jgi:hypothetical protein
VAAAAEKKQKPKRTALAAEFSRTLIHHARTTFTVRAAVPSTHRRGHQREIGLQPGVFIVERHVHGKRVCDDCETLIQAPVPAQVINKRFDYGPTCPPHDCQVFRPPAHLPSGIDLRSSGPGDSMLNDRYVVILRGGTCCSGRTRIPKSGCIHATYAPKENGHSQCQSSAGLDIGVVEEFT